MIVQIKYFKLLRVCRGELVARFARGVFFCKREDKVTALAQQKKDEGGVSPFVFQAGLTIALAVAKCITVSSLTIQCLY